MTLDVLFGFHAVKTTLKHDPSRVQKLLIIADRKDERIGQVIATAQQLNIVIERCNRKVLDELTSRAVHQGVAIQCEPMQAKDESYLDTLLDTLAEPAFLLVLDGVTDPHNLGACIRSADAAGVHAVIAPKNNSAPLNPTVAKVACGAVDVMPYVQVTNLTRTLQHLQQRGVWIAGTAGEAEQDVYQANLSGPLAIVMGAEGKGMRRLTKENCDFLVKLPMAGEVSSLNVSVATGICLYEALRQRRS
ncbi:MAG: 23S rRNA (guanosine(2251)-2'-O)-methyltransferase RlmB [Pseudomonadales bacterium]|nr:23S rRNA (guanosine(2251)-2'-O)-methyltransferase RlmB [Pseudomonadales bacterium]NRA16292.1 23S rRNA (guanosine(2251)-2'-O)-methyltransferase RlmB [Oceanospirillaceae bacterium]